MMSNRTDGRSTGLELHELRLPKDECAKNHHLEMVLRILKQTGAQRLQPLHCYWLNVASATAGPYALTSPSSAWIGYRTGGTVTKSARSLALSNPQASTEASPVP